MSEYPHQPKEYIISRLAFDEALAHLKAGKMFDTAELLCSESRPSPAQHPREYLLITKEELDKISDSLADENDSDETRFPAYDAIRQVLSRKHPAPAISFTQEQWEITIKATRKEAAETAARQARSKLLITVDGETRALENVIEHQLIGNRHLEEIRRALNQFKESLRQEPPAP